MPSVRSALERLEQERATLEGLLVKLRRADGPEKGVLYDIIDGLGMLGSVRTMLDGGNAEERKVVIRVFLKGIEIDTPGRRAVPRWYRVPQGSFVKLVAVGGIEPPTRGL